MLARLKVSTRLGMGFAAVLILMLLVGALALYQIHKLGQINHNLYLHPFAVSNAAQRLNTNSNRIQMDLDQLASGLAQVEDVRLSVETFRIQMESDLRLMAQRYLGDMADVRRVQDLLAKWIPLQNRIFALDRNGDYPMMVTLTRLDSANLARQLRRGSRVLRNFAMDKAGYFTEESMRAQRHYRYALIGSLAAALVLGVLLTFYVARSLLGSLRRVASASELVAKGMPPQALEDMPADALGRLAASLQSMLSGVVGEGRSIRDNLPAHLWMADREMTLTMINPAAAPLLEALAGHPVKDILGRLKVEQVLRDQEGRSASLAMQALEQGKQFEAQVSFRPNGKTLHMQQVLAPVVDLEGNITGVMGVGLDITSRLEMEQALAESEEQFRRAIMSAPQPIMLHAEDGRVIQLNRAWTGLSGYSSEQIKTIDDWVNLAYPGKAAQVKKNIQRLYGLGKSTDEGEFTVRTAGGGRRIWQFSTAPLGRLPDGRHLVLSMAVDLTERKRAEEQTKASEERFRSLVNNVPGVVYRCLVDQHWTMVYLSDEVEDITGYPADDFLGNQVRTYASIIHPGDREAVERQVSQALSENRPFSLEYRLLRADGKVAWIFEKGSRAQNGGQEGRWLDGVILDITAAKQAEQAKERSEILYSALFHRAGDAIIIMEAGGEAVGTIIAANQATADMHGYELSELVGMHISQLNAPGYKQDLYRRFESLDEGENLKLELRHKRKDGGIFPVEVSAGLIELDGKKYVLGMDRDISERLESENALRASEDRFRELFNNMGSGVAIYAPSPDGWKFQIKEMNPAGLRIMAKRREDVIGCDVEEVFPGVAQLGLLEVFRRVWRTGTAEQLPLSVYEDYQINLWVENYVCRLPSGEVVAIFEDVTKRKQAEVERAKLESQLRQSQKLEAIGTLAGGIAHDFNNILMAIMGYAELAREDLPEASPSADSLEQVLVASERAKSLVRQILSFSRREEPDKAPLDVASVVGEVFTMLRASIPTTVEMRLEEPLAHDQVLADPVQIQQVIMNLCTNAAQAMEQNGGVLRVELTRVELDSETAAAYALLEAGSYLCFSVSDTGVGISREVRNRIFEPFFTTKQAAQGTGMGLAVAHGIAVNHGGMITVYSELGEGSKFNVYLPVYGGADQWVQAPSLAPGEFQGDGERVFFVDDEPALADLGKRMLGGLGYQVSSFNSPAEALEAFLAEPEACDLLITDYTMPKMTGVELGAAFLKKRPELPVIVCTGFNNQLREDRARRQGIRSVLYKPLARLDLAKAVRNALQDVHQSQPV
ncbi:MAG: PAS domain S-box protein [Desulfarculaceae bacterium]|nr:PAS domain S-box protein [Desulfarculaceae bacterium]MCF8048771.1 PAS domain S-box protein [Desulfarculaceae bacterium]MCF8099160.1 PAS domain S-box protein [Desulfarculaceae bacterium]MCF8121995.1 PAS domain S-box protein [Desulfarculaceae bacterium]